MAAAHVMPEQEGGVVGSLDDILQRGNGAERQRLVYEANHDYLEVMQEIVEATGA